MFDAEVRSRPVVSAGENSKTAAEQITIGPAPALAAAANQVTYRFRLGLREPAHTYYYHSVGGTEHVATNYCYY